MDSSKYKHGLGLLPGSGVALALAGSGGGSDGSPGANGGSVSIWPNQEVAAPFLWLRQRANGSLQSCCVAGRNS